MKKIMVGLFAFGFAVAGALASQRMSTALSGYEFVPGPIPSCDYKGDICDTGGTFACRVSVAGPILRENNTTTTCGQELMRTTPAQ
jgi:hypothetical protein